MTDLNSDFPIDNSVGEDSPTPKTTALFFFLRTFWHKKRLKTSILLAICTIFSYIAVNLSPEKYWILGFSSLILPFFLLFQLIIATYWLLLWSRYAFIPLFVLAMGAPFIGRTLGFGGFWQTADATQTPNNFMVLSYNVRVFNNYEYLRKENWGYAQKIIEWIAQHPADIKCLQEFYHQEDSELFNTVRALANKRGYFLYTQPKINTQNRYNYFGLAILSRYPIVRGATLVGKPNSYPQAIFADIQIGKDTLRVYNIHLQSMAINEKKLFAQNSLWQRIKDNFKEVSQKLGDGFVNRAKQVDLLATHIAQSPYPVIVAGDLNDTPYSYTYNVLRYLLANAFEQKGQGWGFTYNGKLSFLRIDNQFFSAEALSIQQFETRNDIPYSDHFPTEAIYSWKPHNSKE